MSSPYESRFWRKNWDPGLTDLDPKEFETTYPEMLRSIFEKYPNNIALMFQGLEITYREIDQYSNQFANMLIENGFKKGDAVGINLPNSPEYIYSVIGTLKAG
ncbi:MAG: AMP-binding protein, partial [Promethearchaeota archaeon]